MKTEEEKIRQILKRGMQEPSPGFSARVMQQITEMQKATQALTQPHAQIAGQEWSVFPPTMGSVLKPLALAFGLIALLAIIVSLVPENDFMSIQVSYLSTKQATNIIFSLISFWVLMLLSPWIKKQVYHLSEI
jgi:hypothetical protein